MKNENKADPEEEGLYLARTTHSMQWWNLVVQVYGTAPFFQVDVWDLLNSTLLRKADPDWIYEYGPRLDTLPNVGEWSMICASIPGEEEPSA